MRKIRKFLGFFVIALAGVLAIGAYTLNQYLNVQPLIIPKQGYILMIPPGMSVQKITDQLVKDRVLSHPTWFLAWVRVTDARLQIKAGEYLVTEGTTPQGLIDLLISGKVIQHVLTIVEGYNFETLMRVIQQEPSLKQTLLGLKPQEIMTKLGFPGEHPEGRFFPDTYYFPAGTTDVAFLQRAHKAMKQKLQKAWENRINPFVKTPYEALILASIIEKESGFYEEYEEISGVFQRRLQKGMPLQADPTVIYGAGSEYQGTITTDLLKKMSPYNTYLVSGLPPTPIAMPSETALLAATRPKPGETLYFVAKGDKNSKGHVFSKTLEEHQAAVSKYRKALENGTP